MRRLLAFVLAQLLAAGAWAAAEAEAAPDPYALIAAAIDLNRGLTSYVEMTMVVHRPEWERRSALVGWTRDAPTP